MTEFSFCRKF